MSKDKNNKQNKRFLGEPVFRDFLRKLFILMAILYLLFFGLETILPGLIMDVFNLNLLLLLFLLILSFFIFFPEPGKNLDVYPKAKNEPIKRRLFFFSAIVFLSLVFLLALYKVSFLESLLYLSLALIVGKLLLGSIK